MISSEVIVATVSTVGGAVLGYVGGWLQDIRDRSRRRESTATVLLFELRLMDVCLRELYDLDHPANQVAGSMFPMFETLKSELLLFQPSTAEQVLTAWGYMSDIRARIDALERGTVERAAY